ncbi:WD40 repeat-like protein [Phellopilus nigrolimitatus]|nr:WD40 repeat-like protein [Phellopilus nigrolimitatus]
MRLIVGGDDDSASALSVSPDPIHPNPLDVTTMDDPPVPNPTQSIRNGNTFALPSSNGSAIEGRASISNGLKQTAPLGNARNSAHIVSRVNLPGTRLFEDSYIDREEFVRLVIQSLKDVGYTESASTLESESGYEMESPEVTFFRRCILDGLWSDAEDCLTSLGVNDEDNLRLARFHISQQKYLELLEMQSVNAALYVLRSELAPLNMDVDELHSLSSLIMCSNADDLKHRAKWDGAKGTSRSTLLSTLQRLISPSVMMPQRRFTALIEQAFTQQRTNCLYHNAPYTPETFSLYTDHHCSREAFPLLTTNILKNHVDEVWNIKWSHDGQYLASASKDRTACIWRIGPEIEPNVRECALEKKLGEHKFTVGCLAWSPDDSILLTSTDPIITLWNAKTGMHIREVNSHDETVSALEWLSDGSGFLSGGLDRKIIFWDAEGAHEDIWIKTGVRVTDLAVAPDLSRMVVIGLEYLPTANPKPTASHQDGQNIGGNGSLQTTVTNSKENRLIIYDFASRTQEASIRLDGELTSVKISQDSRYALVNHAPDEVQLWDLESARMARKFSGQRQGQHVIRSCFGGVDGNFIVSGSEDGNVYVWHRDTGVLLEVLVGHGAGSVNAVAWNPRNERMFASCSDDSTVRIWESPHAALLERETRASQSMQLMEQDGKGKGREACGWVGSSASGSGSSISA